MSASFRDSIHRLAAEFVSGVLGAIRGSPLGLLAETTRAARRGPGRPRRSAAGPGSSPGSSSVGAPRHGRVRRSRGRLARRSAGQLDRVVDRIVELVARHPRGLRAEQIRAQLGLSAREMPRPITMALAAGRISKTGEKRATTYHAGAGRGERGGGGGRGKPKKSSRRGGARKARRATRRRPVAKKRALKSRKPVRRRKTGGRHKLKAAKPARAAKPAPAAAVPAA